MRQEGRPPKILDEYVERIFHNPAYRFVQSSDNRIVLWGYVEELGRYVKVVLLEDGETVLTAYVDGRADRWISR